MAKENRQSIYFTKEALNFIGPRNKTLSGGVNQTIERYKTVIDLIKIPTFDTDDILFLKELLKEKSFIPIYEIQNMDSLLSKLVTDKPDLLAQIRELTFIQKIAFIEKIITES